MTVRYIDAPHGAQENLTAGGTAQSFTDWKQVVTGRAMAAYATLEPLGWPLDGSRLLMEDSPALGFWSDPQAPARLQLTLPRRYTATGLTVRFSPATGEWCRRLQISWYAGDGLVAREMAYPTAPFFVSDRAVADFDRVVLESFEPNLPAHMAKIEYIGIGKELWFDPSTLTEVRLKSEIDPLLAAVKPDTMEVTVDCEQTLHLLPQRNQKMELYRGQELQATQYIQRSTRHSSGSYTFYCSSATGLLEEDFLGGMYEKTPVSAVLDQVLEGLPYELHTSLQGATLTGFLSICTRQKALQQIAFALGAAVSTRGDGVIRLLPLTRQMGKPLLKEDIFQGSRLEIQKAVAQVEVTAHRYVRDSQERCLLEDVPIHGENVLLTFSNPHHSYAISGGTLTGSGANWVRITANAPVTLTAKGYVHTAVRHVRKDPLATQGAVYTVDSATLVHSGNVGAVLNRLYGVTALRQSLLQRAVVTSQKTGQTVTCDSPWGERFQGFITQMDLTLTPAGQVGQVTVLGRQLAQDRYGYAGEIYAGEKEVNPWF